MPLTNFVWEKEITMRDGKRGFAGTAKNENNAIIDVFVTEEFLKEQERLSKRDKW